MTYKINLNLTVEAANMTEALFRLKKAFKKIDREKFAEDFSTTDSVPVITAETTGSLKVEAVG